MDLNRLQVSLTKHGAHKIALLLHKYPKDDVLGKVAGAEPGINIDRTQAARNLSVDRRGVVPTFWDLARTLGSDTVDALVLLGIVFSHHKIIRAMSVGRTQHYIGAIERGVVLNGKAFTNFAHTLDELGFSPMHTANRVEYDLRQMFSLSDLAPLALELLKLKLIAAGWRQNTDAVSEMIKHGFHEAVAVSEAEFRNWLLFGISRRQYNRPDGDFFSGADEVPTRSFEFRAGHIPRMTGTISRQIPTDDTEASLAHNQIQTVLYEWLVREFGKDAVGTEVQTGLGTSIDVVTRVGDKCTFYEIKIADSLRACVRQALPQLMEYAYWRCSDKLAERLVIVGTYEVTPEVDAYLQFLRQRFLLPIHYQQFVC